MSAGSHEEEKQNRISSTIDKKTIGFLYANPQQLISFTDIRKIRENQLIKVAGSLSSHGWDSSYSILAIEMVPEEGTPEAKAHLSSLEKLSSLSEEEVRPAFCMY